MSKIKTKEIIICIITLIALVLSIATNVFAEVTIKDINTINSGNKNVQQIEDRGNNTKNNTSNNKNNVLNKTNKTTTMPNTGVDYSILLIVAVCGISAIYAYKKISDYKNF